MKVLKENNMKEKREKKKAVDIKKNSHLPYHLDSSQI